MAGYADVLRGRQAAPSGAPPMRMPPMKKTPPKLKTKGDCPGCGGKLKCQGCGKTY